MKLGQEQFKKAIFLEESIDIDMVYTAIDSFTRAINLSYERDPEVEAISSSLLGMAFYKGLQKAVKAKKHYLDSIRILETLKPKTFNHEQWHKLMMKYMNEIQTEQDRKERDAQWKDEAKLRESLKKEIKEINDHKSQGSRKFLKFVAENYVSYENKKVEISDDDLKESKLKKTILKICKAYHSDKSANSGFTKE